MSNDIDGVSKNNGLPKISGVTASRRVDGDSAAGRDTAKAEASANDTVALTDGARLLQRVEAKLAAAGDVDPARVEALKAAIENGDYQIDDRIVADKILRSDRERG